MFKLLLLQENVMYQTSTYLLEYVALSFALILEDHQSTKHSSNNRAGHGSFIATRGNRCSKSFFHE